MRVWLKFLTRSRYHAAGVAAVLGLAALSLPLLEYLSSAVVALATLRYGAAQGLLVAGLAGVAVAAGIWFSGVEIQLPLIAVSAPAAVVMLTMNWLPAWAAAGVLRFTRSQGAAIVVAGILGAAMVLVLHLRLGDGATLWQEHLSRGVSSGEYGTEAQTEAAAAMIAVLNATMTGFLAAGMMIGAIVSMLLGRWWQAAMDNPGGFGQEFRALNLGRRTAMVGGMVLVTAFVANAETDGLALELSIVVLYMFLIQGLSLAHKFAKQRGRRGLLVGMYVSLPVTWVLVALLGLTDALADLRRRIAHPENTE